MDERDIGRQVTEDKLYNLPLEITEDEDLQQIYTVYTQLMDAEVGHLSVPSSAKQIIERINYYYIVMRERERQGLRFTGTPAEKALHNAWLTSVQEFNKMVVAADIDRHRQLLRSITNIIMSTLSSEIKDESLRKTVSLRIAAAMEQAGVA